MVYLLLVRMLDTDVGIHGSRREVISAALA